METTQEKVFHQDKLVTVTQSRFVAGGKTYAMRNISSVSLFEMRRNRLFEIVVLVIGLLCLLNEGSRVAGVIVVLFGIALWFLLKDKYSVRINSNSGEADGFISTDRSHIEKIVNALNDAIIHRG